MQVLVIELYPRMTMVLQETEAQLRWSLNSKETVQAIEVLLDLFIFHAHQQIKVCYHIQQVQYLMQNSTSVHKYIKFMNCIGFLDGEIWLINWLMYDELIFLAASLICPHSRR